MSAARQRQRTHPFVRAQCKKYTAIIYAVCAHAVLLALTLLVVCKAGGRARFYSQNSARARAEFSAGPARTR